MVQFNQPFVQDLKQPIKVRHCGSIVFNADNESNVVSVRLFNGSEPVAISGSVVGAVVCPDGATVPLTGSYSGNTASITLTGDCFALLGEIGVGIQIVNGAQRTTVLKAKYNVETLTTETVVDPGSRITLEVGDLVDDIEAALASIPANYSDLLAAIAPNYSGLTFPVKAGTFCWYDGTLYQAQQDIATSEAWTAAHWASSVLTTSLDEKLADVDDELGDLKSQITELSNGYVKLNVTEFIENKTLSSDGKSETANNNRWLSDFIPVTPGSMLYFYVTATTERCAFYTSDDYADVTGGTFTVAAGNPTAKVVPAGAAYIKIGWHKNNGIPNVVTIAPFIDDAAGNGVINKVWSANKSANEAANVSAALSVTNTKITGIIGKSQFETVNATVETGYYKKDGTRGNGGQYRTATTAVNPGEILEVSGYTLKGTAFVLIVYFDSNNDLLSYAYENANVSAETYTDLVVVVPQGAAKIGVNCMNYSATLAIKRLANYASTSNISDTNDTITKNDKKVDDISRYVNFEDESGTFANGFYNAVSGQWQANNSYGTITFPASYGDLFLVTGETLAVAGFALALIFNENDEIIERVYNGKDLSAKTSVRDMPLYISQQNAAWIALLGSYYYDAENYYPHAKRAIIKYAHVRKTGICFGDSTFGNSNPKNDIPSKLTARTGNTVLNGAFGGCRMSSYNGNYGAFSMYKLADAICTDTWTDQDAAMADPEFEPPAYAAQHLTNLKNTDFSKVDFITIAYGTNDWRAGKPLDDEQNPKNTNTIAGALRYSLEKIMTTYPQIDVYVLCPIWRVVKLDGDTDENPTGYCDITPNGLPTADQYYLMDVCNKLKEVADAYHVTFIDDFNIGINQYNWKNWLEDGTHPNSNGKQLMIGNMIKSIKNLLP